MCYKSYGRVFCRSCQWMVVDFGKALALGYGVKYYLVVLEVGGFHNHFHTVGEGVFGGVPFGKLACGLDLAGGRGVPE